MSQKTKKKELTGQQAPQRAPSGPEKREFTGQKGVYCIIIIRC